MNFNDFGCSIITLFHIMVVNNWFVTTNMLSALYGGTIWPKIFVSSFWVFVVLIVANLIIANVIEIYDSKYIEVESYFELIAETKELRNHLNGKSELELE